MVGEPKKNPQSTSAVQIFFIRFFHEDAIDVITGIVFANTHIWWVLEDTFWK